MAVVSSIPRGFSGPACSFSLAEPVRGTAPFRGRPAEFAPKSLGPSQRSIGVRSQGEAPPTGAATITVQGDAPAGDSWQALARRPPFDLPPSMGGGSLLAGRRGFDVTSPIPSSIHEPFCNQLDSALLADEKFIAVSQSGMLSDPRYASLVAFSATGSFAAISRASASVSSRRRASGTA